MNRRICNSHCPGAAACIFCSADLLRNEADDDRPLIFATLPPADTAASSDIEPGPADTALLHRRHA